MATSITTINSSDQISNSRTDINNNFASLNTNKIETSTLDTDAALAANSDAKIPSQKAVKAYVDALGGLTNLVPTGTILPYGGAAAPSYYLLCDGSAISRSTYATLFAIIGTSYGVGNGSTTFNLPDMRGRVIVGSGTGVKVFTFSSRSTNTITVTGSSNSNNNEVQTGQAVLYSAPSGAMTGLVDNTTYYLIRVAYNQFTLASTLANAQNGTAISLSSNGTGTQTFTLTSSTRTIGDTGGEENHAMSSTELLSHDHSPIVRTSGNTGGSDMAGASGANSNSGSTNTTTYPNGVANISMATKGGNTAMNNMQAFMVANHIIKY